MTHRFARQDSLRSLGFALAAALGWACAGAAAAQGAAYSATPLAGDLLAVSGPDGNVVVAQDADGLVLIGGAREQNAAALVDFVTAETGAMRIATLVNTDWKPARTGLNVMLGDGGTQIVAHANAVQWLAHGDINRADDVTYAPIDPAGLPDTTFYDDGMALPFGEGEIRLGYVQQAHCDSDVYAYFPGADVLVTGPAVRSDGWIMFDWWAGAYLGSLVDALDVLLEVAGPDTVIVPSSGPLMTRAELEDQRAMYRDMFDRMAEQVLTAQSTVEAVRNRPTEGVHPEWPNADEFVVRAHQSYRWHIRRDPRLDPIP